VTRRISGASKQGVEHSRYLSPATVKAIVDSDGRGDAATTTGHAEEDFVANRLTQDLVAPCHLSTDAAGRRKRLDHERGDILQSGRHINSTNSPAPYRLPWVTCSDPPSRAGRASRNLRGFAGSCDIIRLVEGVRQASRTIS